MNATHRIAGIGEVLWDLLPEGRKLGGAPANFTYQATALGGLGFMVSRTGDDDLGREARELLRGRGVDDGHVSLDPDHPTGTVLARLDDQGKASYEFPPDVAWDHLTLSPADLDLAATLNGVCFGSLAQRSPVSRAAIHDFLREVPATALRLFDINLRGDFYARPTIEASLAAASVLKLSDEELPVLARMFGLNGDDREVLETLCREFGLDGAALTMGGRGSLLFWNGKWDQRPGIAVTVRDTVGAGDAYGAALCLGLLEGLDPATVNGWANRVAAFVCTRAGAMPDMPATLRLAAEAQTQSG